MASVVAIAPLGGLFAENAHVSLVYEIQRMNKRLNCHAVEPLRKAAS